jgi:hypothetical protein
MLDAEFTVTEPPELLTRLNKLAERFSSAVPDQAPLPTLSPKGEGRN